MRESLLAGGTLRDRLGELVRRRRLPAAGAGVGVAEDEVPIAARPRRTVHREIPGDEVGVEAFLPGGEWRGERGAVWVHERLRSELEHPSPAWGRLDDPPEEETDLVALRAIGLERALFLDLETGGLASSPVFLAGTMHWNGSDFVLRQYFARHYGEEAALLGALARAARDFEVLITFNGKSYDAPFLRGRALVNGVPIALPVHHLDLLHASRRRFRDRLPDCRLQTLELHVCRRRRAGDVPGDEVPGLYHDYVRHGDPWRLVPVFHHNLLDVVTMAELLRRLCSPLGASERARSRDPERPSAAERFEAPGLFDAL